MYQQKRDGCSQLPEVVRFYSGCSTGLQVVFEKKIEQQWGHDQTNRETRLTRRHSQIRQVCECS